MLELIKEILSELVSLSHRGSTTQKEREAAEIIERRLREFGYVTRVEPFRSPRTYSWEVIAFAMLVSGGLLLSLTSPTMGAVLSVLGLWSFVRHFDGRDTVLGKLIRKKTSQNIVGESKGGDKEKIIYLMAHYDTARASHLFHPLMVKNFRQSFLISAALIFISPLVAFSGLWLAEIFIYKIIVWGMAIYVSVQILFLIHRELFHKHVNGANDNGSGVTVMLALAQYFSDHVLENTMVKIVATGCEEVGLYGARAFVRRFGDDLASENTYVLNFDNVGKGDLYYCVGEGMLGFHHYDSQLVTMAEHLSFGEFSDVKPLRYTLAQFDSLILTHENIKTITFISLDDHKGIPNWHWYSDTIENIEWSSIRKAVDFGIAMIQQIDRSG